MDELVYKHLKNHWSFSIEFKSFCNIYKSEKITKHFSIDPYLKNNALIKEAEDLLNCLNQYEFKENIISESKIRN